MIQTKCINGHFFDCEEYEYCPMCGALSIEKDKVPDEAKKKKGFDFFKPKPPIKPVETKPVPPGRVDKTFGILGFGKKNSDRIVTQPVAISVFRPLNMLWQRFMPWASTTV